MAYQKRLNWLDHLVYKIFYWRWNKILMNRPDLRELMIAHIKAFDVLDNGDDVIISITKKSCT